MMILEKYEKIAKEAIRTIYPEVPNDIVEKIKFRFYEGSEWTVTTNLAFEISKYVISTTA